MNKIPYNKVCSLEDFSDPELSVIIHDVFQYDFMKYPPKFLALHRKRWEVAMSIRALKDFGVLHRDSVILGVGAGTEGTSYYLTRHVKQVFATDIYLNAGIWSGEAPFLMLINPQQFASCEYEEDRLVVQHMDGRWLQYPDNTFDGIYSSGSIEHFGNLDFIANAGYEMGRVLKPGGILSLSTEYKVSGPPGGDGWDAFTYILSQERIMRFIVEASGLELVDELDTKFSNETMNKKLELITFIEDIGNDYERFIERGSLPHIILHHEGYVFCSVHLVLRKTNRYPVTNNSWAAPSDETKRAVEQLRQQAIAEHDKKVASLPVMESPAILSESLNESGVAGYRPFNPYAIIAAHNEWQTLRLSPDISSERIKYSKALKFFYCTLARIRKLGKIWEAERGFHEAVIFELRKSQQNEEYFNLCLKNHDAMIRESDATAASLKDAFANEQLTISKLKDAFTNEQLSISNQQRNLDALEEKVIKMMEMVDNINELLKNIDSRVRMNTSLTRSIQHHLDVAVLSQPREIKFEINSNRIVEHIAEIEQRYPELMGKEPIEVWVTPVSFEELLFDLVEYFGPRINPFRLPSVIYHIALDSTEINIKAFQAVYEQLKPDGLFVFVAPSQSPQIPDMELLHFEEVDMDGLNLSFSIFQAH